MGIYKSIWADEMDHSAPQEEPGPDEPEAPKELLDAERRCPNVKFVKSCREFFERRGFLSDAQKRALTFSGTSFRRARQFNHFTPYDDDFEDSY